MRERQGNDNRGMTRRRRTTMTGMRGQQQQDNGGMMGTRWEGHHNSEGHEDNNDSNETNVHRRSMTTMGIP
jgi:hypothetical protein